MQNPAFIKITSRLFLASLLLAMACCSRHAQDSTAAAAPSATPPVASPAPSASGVAPLPEDAARATPFKIAPGVQEQLSVAYQKALQDPAVLSAQAALKASGANIRGLVRKKAVAADPTMKPVFDKADKAVADQTAGGVLAVLSPDEAKKLHDAFEKLGTDQEVKDASAKAETEKKAVNDAVRAAILRADPSLAPVLDAIDANAKNQAVSRIRRMPPVPANTPQ